MHIRHCHLLSGVQFKSLTQQQSTCQHVIDTIVIMFWIFVTINYLIVTSRVYIHSWIDVRTSKETGIVTI